MGNVGEKETEDRRQETEDRRQKTEDRRQESGVRRHRGVHDVFLLKIRAQRLVRRSLGEDVCLG